MDRNLALKLVSKLKYDVNKNGCFIVNNRKPDSHGYIQCSSRKLSIDGKKVIFRAHRLVYLCDNGELSNELVIRHTCDNRLCINPNHLIIGTQLDNISDMDERNRRAIGENVGSSKLSAENVSIIKNSTKSTSNLANDFDVSIETIRLIRKNEIWKHVS